MDAHDPIRDIRDLTAKAKELAPILFQMWHKRARTWGTEVLLSYEEQPVTLRDVWVELAGWHLRQVNQAAEAAAFEAAEAARRGAPCGEKSEIVEGQVRVTFEGPTSEVEELLRSINPWPEETAKVGPIHIPPRSMVGVGVTMPKAGPCRPEEGDDADPTSSAPAPPQGTPENEEAAEDD